MASLASLLVPGAQVAQQDHSWLNGIANTIGGAIDQRSENRSFGKLADRIGQGGSQGAMMASVAPQAPMMGGARQQPAMVRPAPASGGMIPDAYYSSIRTAESGGNDAAKNPRSSATGRYQFTSGTWNDLMQSNPELGLTADGRLDPQQQERAIRAFTASNARALTSAGLPVDPGTLYAAHFLGANGAQQVLGQADDASVASIVGPEVVQANPFLSNMTVGQFRQWAAEKGGNDRGGYGAPMDDAVSAVTALAEGGTPPTQVADASGGFQNVPGQPIPQGGADIATIQFMLRDPNLREMGLKLWQQNVTGSTGEPWQFVQAPDGTLLRANQQTGAVESIGQFAEPQDATTGGTEYGLTPIYGTDANGDTVLVQVAKDGTSIQTPLPEGFRPTPGISNSDLGTSIITRNNRTGQIIDQRDKDLAGVEREKAIGGAEGEAIASASGDARSAQNALDLVASIRNDPNRQRGTGFSSLGNRIPGTAGFDFQQKVNQATSGAFLTAIQQLRGMGALSNAEGQTATQAVTRLNTAASEEEFLAALADYEKVVRQGLEAAQRRMPQQQSQPAGEPSIDDLLEMYGE